MSDTPTARGDRAGRRRDVLRAATEIVEESGWTGFSIRAVAARAGVSTGAVYQWFAGKHEIFGELYDGEFRAGLEELDTIPEGVSLEAMVRSMLDWAVARYERLGRYAVEFSGPGRDVAPDMAPIRARIDERGSELLERCAAAEGVVLVADEHRLTWFWAACHGVAERLTLFPPCGADDRREGLLRFAAESLTRSLTAPQG